MSSIRAFLLDCFLQRAKFLTIAIAFSSDGQVPLKQFIMDNPLHIPPDAAIVFSVDGTNVSGGFCSFGASIELVKKEVA
jgi:hypothetical protein